MYINQVLGPHPTCTARPTAGIDMVACPTEDRAPLIAVIEDRKREKQRWQHNHAVTLLKAGPSW